MPTSLSDGWTRAGVKRIARKLIGPNARVWVHDGRCTLGVEAPARKVRGEKPKGPAPRLVIAVGATWAELAQRAFVDSLRAYEKAAAEGLVPTLEARKEAARAELGRLMGVGAGERQTDPGPSGVASGDDTKPDA